MYTILKLFGRSPFTLLRSHMDLVNSCVHLLIHLFDALEKKDFPLLEETANRIFELEHAANLTKNDIRNHLPKSLFLPIERSQLLEILQTQDRIADSAKDVAVLVTLKNIDMNDSFRDNFRTFLNKNIESYDHACAIIKEMQDLLESSFGGIEAEKVKEMVENVAFSENKVDLIQRGLLKQFFLGEKEMSYSTFFLWLKIFEAVGSISNLSEKLANRVRMTLDLK